MGGGGAAVYLVSKNFNPVKRLSFSIPYLSIYSRSGPVRDLAFSPKSRDRKQTQILPQRGIKTHSGPSTDCFVSGFLFTVIMIIMIMSSLTNLH